MTESIMMVLLVWFSMTVAFFVAWSIRGSAAFSSTRNEPQIEVKWYLVSIPKRFDPIELRGATDDDRLQATLAMFPGRSQGELMLIVAEHRSGGGDLSPVLTSYLVDVIIEWLDNEWWLVWPVWREPRGGIRRKHQLFENDFVPEPA